MSFFDKFPYTNFHELNLDWIISQIKTINVNMMKAVESAKNAKVSEENAKTSEDKAKISETNAKASEDKAKISETNAKASEDKAKSSETNAKASETNAKASETNAKVSEDKAKISETNAKASENAAAESEINANISADSASINAQNASKSALNAKASATAAQSVESNVSSTVYYYDTGVIDCTIGLTNRLIALTMRVILRNGFMYIYGTLAPNNEATQPANTSMVVTHGLLSFKYKEFDFKDWIDQKLPNIDWDNLCGSCLLHGSGNVAVTDTATSQELSSSSPIELLGGIYYVASQTSTGTKTYRMQVTIDEVLPSYIDKSVKYDARNVVARYTMVIPIKFL